MSKAEIEDRSEFVIVQSVEPFNICRIREEYLFLKYIYKFVFGGDAVATAWVVGWVEREQRKGEEKKTNKVRVVMKNVAQVKKIETNLDLPENNASSMGVWFFDFGNRMRGPCYSKLNERTPVRNANGAGLVDFWIEGVSLCSHARDPAASVF